MNSICWAWASPPLALALVASLITLPRSRNQKTCEPWRPSLAWVLANDSTFASARCSRPSRVGDQVLDGVDVAADVEEAPGVGPDERRAGVSGFAFVLPSSSLGAGGWMTWRVTPWKVSVATLAPASSPCLVLRFRTSVIFVGVLAGVGDDRQGDRQLGIVLA